MENENTKFTEGRLNVKGLPTIEVEALMAQLFQMNAGLKASVATGEPPEDKAMKAVHQCLYDLMARTSRIIGLTGGTPTLPNDPRTLSAFVDIYLEALQLKGFYQVGTQEMPL